jgi:hypothetical protein
MGSPSDRRIERTSGRIPKWPKGTDCKSVIRGFKSRSGLSTTPRPAPAEAGFFVGVIGDGGCARASFASDRRWHRRTFAAPIRDPGMEWEPFAS